MQIMTASWLKSPGAVIVGVVGFVKVMSDALQRLAIILNPKSYEGISCRQNSENIALSVFLLPIKAGYFYLFKPLKHLILIEFPSWILSFLMLTLDCNEEKEHTLVTNVTCPLSSKPSIHRQNEEQWVLVGGLCDVDMLKSIAYKAGAIFDKNEVIIVQKPNKGLVLDMFEFYLRRVLDSFIDFDSSISCPYCHECEKYGLEGNSDGHAMRLGRYIWRKLYCLLHFLVFRRDNECMEVLKNLLLLYSSNYNVRKIVLLSLSTSSADVSRVIARLLHNLEHADDDPASTWAIPRLLECLEIYCIGSAIEIPQEICSMGSKKSSKDEILKPHVEHFYDLSDPLVQFPTTRSGEFTFIYNKKRQGTHRDYFRNIKEQLYLNKKGHFATTSRLYTYLVSDEDSSEGEEGVQCNAFGKRSKMPMGDRKMTPRTKKVKTQYKKQKNELMSPI
eukprot:Nk52_evm15s1224 gene=Nk52_evmTU15s1224